MKKNKKTVSIIGFGRFGKVLADILKEDFDVWVYDLLDKSKEAKDLGVAFVDLKKALSSTTIFYAIPINKFEEVIKKHSLKLKNQLIIDVLSIKCFPKQILEKYLPKNCRAILTHPMFGPDSLKAHGLSDLKLVMDKFSAANEEYMFWKNYFLEKKLDIIEMSAEEHDRLAADSQGVAFFVSRVLSDFRFKRTPIDTLWAQKLNDIVEALSHDSWELFLDLQTKNSYTRIMRIRLGESLDKIYNLLIPKRIKEGKLVLGIQGGKGSFNEEAALYFLKRGDIKNYEIKYLFTTENVLKALHEGEIDRGQFAIHNSTGGIVDESIEAMARYKFKIVEKFGIKISHALMTRKDVEIQEIEAIMTHPQVLKQCRKNLMEKYPNLKQTSGEGELVDHAKVAQFLAEGKLSKNIAVMGSKVLAEIYDLKIIEDNLQDLADNFTGFLQVERN